MTTQRRRLAVVFALTVTVLCGAAGYRLGEGIQMAVWGGMLAFFLLAPRLRAPGSGRLRGHVIGMAAVGAAIFLGVPFLLAAMTKTLAASPYDRSLPGIFYNLLRTVPGLCVLELTRGFAVSAIYAGPPHLRRTKTAAVYLLLLMAAFPFARLGAVKDARDAFYLGAQYLFPLMAQGAALMMLALRGGASACLAFAVIPPVFRYIFPVLPSLPWLPVCVWDMLLPVGLLLLAFDAGREAPRRVRRESRTSRIAFGVALAAVVGLCWFSAGVFGVRPLVVLTGSMEPGIMPGDVVLVRRFTQESEINALQVGDVINFQKDDINVTHRIVSILTDEAGNLTFYTKGDNNDSQDGAALMPNDINGRIIRVVPKVGLPVLLMWSGRDAPEGVETGQ